MQVEWGVADIVPVPVVTPSAHAPALEAIDPSPALSLPVGDNKGTLGAIVERGPIVPLKKSETPRFPIASDEFIPPAGFRDSVKRGAIYPVADVGFIPPAEFRISVPAVPVSMPEPKPVSELGEEPEAVTVVESVTPVVPDVAPEPEALEPELALVPSPALAPTPLEPQPDERESARVTRTLPPREKPEPEFDLEPAIEDGRKLRTNYAVVRNPKLRAMAIHIHGRSCCVCSFNFDAFFGEELARGYIEIHHLNKIADGERSTDPATDLAPLCGNCHAMADRLTLDLDIPPASIADLQRLLIPNNADPSQ